MRASYKFYGRKTMPPKHPMSIKSIYPQRQKATSTDSFSALVLDFKNPFAISSSSARVPLQLVTREQDAHNLAKAPKVTFKDVAIPPYLPTDTFDLACPISTSIPMHIIPHKDGPIMEDIPDIEYLKKKHVNTIVHVYQEFYAQDTRVTGFGDFVRGCLYVLQFCRQRDLQCRIVIAHPIALFLEQFGEKALKFASHLITMFVPSNWSHSIYNNDQYIEGFALVKDREKEYIEYLNKLPVTSEGIIYSYNILFPYNAVSQEDKEFVRAMLHPNAEMQEYITKAMFYLRLGGIKGYIVVHIRSGDAHLVHGSSEFASKYVGVITKEIQQLIFDNKEKRILLIADNNDLKRLLKHVFFDNVICLFQEITHLGEGSILSREKVKNTLLDFYLMSCAHSIYSWTTYPHGSGFSYWCAVIYNVPYKCRYMAT